MKTTMLAAIALLASAALTQTHTIPTVAANTAGNSSNSNYPWGFNAFGTRELAVYDSSNFAGLNAPIVITGLRWRANESATSWTGGEFAEATVKLSTAAVHHTAVSTNWNANHGGDVRTNYSGPVTILPGGTAPGTIGATFINLSLQRPFLYDPSQGDLAIEVDHVNGLNYTGNFPPSCDYVTNGSASEVISSSSSYPNASNSINRAPVVELSYTPVTGLLADFAETATTGPSPLTVIFTDLSYTAAPGGIQTWEWDFDNDGIVDSTLQNPTHTYTSCGDFDVRLTVTDGVNGPDTIIVPDLVHIDEFTPAFTYAHLTPPNIQFTDTSTPAATAWAWDFDGDGVTDSVQQNPVWTAPNQCAVANVKLTAVHSCRIEAVTQPVFAAPNPAVIGTLQGGLTGNGGNLFDVIVTASDGIRVCGLRIYSSAPGTGEMSYEVYLTEDTYVGKEATAAPWRRVTTGSAVKSATGNQILDVGVTPFFMPPGDYGVAIYQTYSRTGQFAGLRVTHSSFASAPFVRPDFTIHPNNTGKIVSGFFNGFGATQRLWNGGLYYTKCSTTSESAYGVFATGCAGSLGVPELSTTTVPRLGQDMMVSVDRLPEDLAVMVLGLSHTTSQFGALPVDLGASGAPGCMLRIDFFANVLLIGNSNTATWSWNIPNHPALVCLPFFNQALVLDSGINALGAVMSDAAGGVLGN